VNRRLCLAGLLGALALAGSAWAAEFTFTGAVFTGPDRIPVGGVEVDLEVAGHFTPVAATSDAAGRFSARVTLPRAPTDAVTVNARYRKDGFDPLQPVVRCTPGAARACPLDPVALIPTAGIATLTPEEKQVLEGLRSAEGRTLYLLPYQVLPSGPTAPHIDGNFLAASLRTAIATRLQELDADPAVFDYEPLDPVGLMPLPAPIAAATSEKAKAVGEKLNALGVITGTGLTQAGAGGTVVDMTSSFVIMPTDEAQSRTLLVHDQNMPAALLSSAELSQRLSPLWGQSTLLAICRQELGRAHATRDRSRLERLRAYLVAERSRTGRDEGMKLADLEKLLRQVDRELAP